MRPPRLLAASGRSGLYHITSRVVDKRIIFQEKERWKFLKLAKGYAEFGGIDLVSWCLMGNHFHLLVRVPVQDVEAIPDAEMVERLGHILSPNRLGKVVGRLNATSDAEERRSILAAFRKRIGHLPSYVKAVKQEFSQWFNFVNDRDGTLWEGRYHSTLIEDTGGGDPENAVNGAGGIARIVASYIDMNPVRAKVEGDPKDSDWSSFGAALRGDATALRGLRVLWGAGVGNGNGETGGDGKMVAARISDGKLFLDVHRRWILRGVDVRDVIGADAGREGQENGVHPKPGRPARAVGLRNIRLLGSRDFCDRFRVSTPQGAG